MSEAFSDYDRRARRRISRTWVVRDPTPDVEGQLQYDRLGGGGVPNRGSGGSGFRRPNSWQSRSRRYNWAIITVSIGVMVFVFVWVVNH